MTSDLKNFTLYLYYDSSDDMIISNGSTLTISHIDSTILIAPTQSFFLDNVYLLFKRTLFLFSHFVKLTLCPLNFFPLILL